MVIAALEVKVLFRMILPLLGIMLILDRMRKFWVEYILQTGENWSRSSCYEIGISSGSDGSRGSGSYCREVMKISVITINYNNGEQLEATIQSVVSNVTVLRELLGEKAEYIVIDGGSVDCSVSVLQKYSEYISYWISEKDKGIYHAMNKGISVAQGSIVFSLIQVIPFMKMIH